MSGHYHEGDTGVSHRVTLVSLEANLYFPNSRTSGQEADHHRGDVNPNTCKLFTHLDVTIGKTRAHFSSDSFW